MKIIAFLTILVSINFVHSQSIYKSCDEGTNDAISHFNSKKYTLTTLGQVYFPEFQDFQIKVAKEKYGITLTRSDCVLFPYNSCYKKTMRELVLKKFGTNIEEKIYREALVNLKKSKKYIEEIKPKIDTGYVFNPAHINAEFPKEYGTIKNFLLHNTQELKKMKYWSVLADVIIEKDGSISFLKFNKEDLNEEVEYEIRRLLLIMPKWKPATYYEEKVRSKRTISFSCRYNLEIMNRIRKERK
ncbi:hypothetical protein GOQ30_14685 [Flavobacterium sp. TP390]|uniref:TonB C-terminal domain-containing protein n=1 Tax=Flavobacterium profundi TaxID=1774945 RepID=A0A6I4IUS5_9FLAO|nr:hypothetical protein [Flavobacterium profundi]MVO10418.1 hypothetical protein [Flavobacterium profundi]